MKRLVLVAALLAAAAAGAQPVYRCGNSYSAQPCPGAARVEVGDAVSASDAARARENARNDMQRAREMEKARLAQDKLAPKAVIPAVAAPAPEKKPVTKKEGGKKAKPQEFVAAVPGTGKTKK